MAFLCWHKKRQISKQNQDKKTPRSVLVCRSVRLLPHRHRVTTAEPGPAILSVTLHSFLETSSQPLQWFFGVLPETSFGTERNYDGLPKIRHKSRISGGNPTAFSRLSTRLQGSSCHGGRSERTRFGGEARKFSEGTWGDPEQM